MTGIRFACLGTATLAMFLVLGRGCDFGSVEGDRCNALLEHDECNSGLHCTQVSCSATYCCPDNGSSSHPNCATITACNDDAGSDEAGNDEAGNDEAGNDEAGNDEAGGDASAADAAED